MRSGDIIFLVIGLSIIGWSWGKNVLSMHLIHDSDVTLSQSLQHAIDFLTETNSVGSMCGNEMLCVIFLPSTASDDMVMQVQSKPYIAIEFISYTLIKDNGIGKRNQQQEYVTGQIASIQKTLSMVQDLHGDDKKHNILSLSFSWNSYPITTPTLLHIFDFMKKRSIRNSEVILLEKCQSMSSISDWHDLMVLGLIVASGDAQQSPVWEWIGHLQAVFTTHANTHRQAFNLLDPRPAILEANVQLRNHVNVSYFYPSMFDAHTTHTFPVPSIPPDRFNTDSMHSTANRSAQWTPLMSLQCDGTPREQLSCLTLHHKPISWNPRAPSALETRHISWQQKFHMKQKKLTSTSLGQNSMSSVQYTDIVTQFDEGPHRFRYTPYNDKPADFCWSSGYVRLLCHVSI